MSDRTTPPYSMTEDDVVHCPMCDVCVSTTGRPFETPNSVVAHIASAHDGYGYEEARSLMDNPTREASTTQTDAVDDDTDNMDSDTETISFEEPSGGESFEESSGAGDDSENVELPCGHEHYDPSEAPSKPFKIECEQCGNSWRVEE